MDLQRVNFIAAFIAGSLAGCAGFLAGSWLTVRERSMLKRGNAALAREVSETGDAITALESQSQELMQELESAQAMAGHWSEECLRLEEALSAAWCSEPAIVEQDVHPPMVVDWDMMNTHLRISELEREIAALKEMMAARNLPAAPAPTETALRQTSDTSAVAVPAVKGQCTAITKSGARCSRTSRSNGKCWQHGG